MNITFIRHGMTKGNKERRYVGRTEESILPEELLKIKKEQLDIKPVSAVYCSPMQRCLETANAIYPEQTPIEIEELRECDFGSFEYRTAEELSDHPAYQAWIDSNGILPFPQGESVERFKKRCCEGFLQVLRSAKAKRQEAIALVVHGGTIMAILEAYGRPERSYYEWQVKNLAGFVTSLQETPQGAGFVLRVEQKIQ